jgi:protein-S-isoprenylcysteine O-methyltransferase Ste14
MDTFRYWFAVILVVWLPPAVIWWYIVHPFIGFWRRFGARGALVANIVIALAIAWGLWSLRGLLVGRDLGTHWLLTGIGIALVALAVVMGSFRRRQLPTKILSGLPEMQADGRGGRLLTEGVYARVRHPRYLEVAAAVFGYAALANYTGGWLVAAAVVPALHLVVLLEERELARRFGAEFEAYRARVPRYLPRRRVG